MWQMMCGQRRGHDKWGGFAKIRPMTEPHSLTATCHCGAVSLRVAARPEYINECNCSLCGKLGIWWGYFAEDDAVIEGETASYARADRAEPTVTIHRCARCGCCTHFTLLPQFVKNTGITAIKGVNMRLFDRAYLQGLELRFPDGANWDGIGQWGFVKDAVVVA
jgi:hypothetical protein